MQALPTSDGYQYLKQAREEGFEKADLRKLHLTTDQFVEKFYASDIGQALLEKVSTTSSENSEFVKSIASNRYANSSYDSLKLLVQREVLLWWRDKYQIKAKFLQGMLL